MFGSFEKHVGQVHGLINEHILQSFQYSIMVILKLLLLFFKKDDRIKFKSDFVL